MKHGPMKSDTPTSNIRTLPRTGPLAQYIDHEFIHRFDTRIDAQFDRLRGNRVADRCFYSISESANHSLCWHGLTLLCALTGRVSWRRACGISLCLGIESAIVNGPIKLLFRRDRPVVTVQRPHKLRTPLTTSFPSGHATSATCAAMMLGAQLTPRFLRVPLVFFAGLVASSRVFVRIHHASDVVGGIAVGAVLGAVFRRYLPK